MFMTHMKMQTKPFIYSDKDVDKVNQIIKDCFDWCDKNNKPYTLSRLAIFLDIDRNTLVNYGNDKNPNKLILGAINRAKDIIQAYAEECLYDKDRRNMTGVVFALKNNYAWKDTTEVDHKGQLEYSIKLPTDLIETVPQSALIEAEAEAIDEE